MSYSNPMHHSTPAPAAAPIPAPRRPSRAELAVALDDLQHAALMASDEIPPGPLRDALMESLYRAVQLLLRDTLEG